MLDPVDALVEVDSTTTSPTLRPLTISVSELPTRPTTTDFVACWPFLRTVTVELFPVVVIAELGTTRTFVFDPVMTVTLAVIPSRTELGGLSSAMVTL